MGVVLASWLIGKAMQTMVISLLEKNNAAFAKQRHSAILDLAALLSLDGEKGPFPIGLIKIKREWQQINLYYLQSVVGLRELVRPTMLIFGALAD